MKNVRGSGFPVKKASILLVLMVVIFNLISCQKSSKDAFFFRELSFLAEVEWEKDGEKFCAKIYNTPSQKLRIFALDVSVVEDGEGSRAEYVLPDELQGISIKTISDGKYEASLEGARVSLGNASELAFPLRLIFEQKSGDYVGEKIIDGEKVQEYSTFGEIGQATYFIDSKTKLPKEIYHNGTSVKFIWIELT